MIGGRTTSMAMIAAGVAIDWRRRFQDYPSYVLDEVTFKIGGLFVDLHDVYVLTEPTGLPADFSGNLGRSGCGQLSSHTPAFRNMTLSVDARQIVSGKKARGPATQIPGRS